MSRETNGGRGEPNVSRRSLLRSAGVGGLALAGSGLVAPSADARTPEGRADGWSVEVNRLSGEALDSTARAVTDRPDLRNVVADARGYDAATLVDDAAAVFAAEHTLDDGTERTVVTFALDEDQVVMHVDAHDAAARPRSQAKRFEIRDDPQDGGSLVRVAASANGDRVRSAASTTGCSGCEYGDNGSISGEYSDQDCVSYDLGCLNSLTGGMVCAATCLISRAACVACLVAALGLQAHQCCTNWVTDCITCSPGSP